MRTVFTTTKSKSSTEARPSAYANRFSTSGIFLLFILLSTGNVCAEICKEASGYTCEQIVNAIYIAEGAEKTKYPYGIKSVPCNGHDECRRICFNTVRNNVRRWRTAVEKGDTRDYLTFLWHRYCPPSEHTLNNHWLKNVSFWLKRG